MYCSSKFESMYYLPWLLFFAYFSSFWYYDISPSIEAEFPCGMLMMQPKCNTSIIILYTVTGVKVQRFSHIHLWKDIISLTHDSMRNQVESNFYKIRFSVVSEGNQGPWKLYVFCFRGLYIHECSSFSVSSFTLYLNLYTEVCIPKKQWFIILY